MIRRESHSETLSVVVEYTCYECGEDFEEDSPDVRRLGARTRMGICRPCTTKSVRQFLDSRPDALASMLGRMGLSVNAGRRTPRIASQD